MKLTIEITLDNDAFSHEVQGDQDAANEVGRILRDYARTAQAEGNLERKLMDANGNTVGVAIITQD